MRRGSRRVSLAIAVGLVVVCVLSTLPVAGMALNDDFSYAFIARGLARTGHLRYDGWATPMLGFQAWWAALWIRLFGFSFTLVRFSILPFAAGCAALIYGLSRGAGLNPSLSLFGTLTLTLSPLFIPLAASFMTDVPGLFFWLACIYCGLRAARAATTRAACGWLAAAAVLGVTGGTVRQAVWAAPLLVIPAVAWIRIKEPRRRERFPIACAAVYWLAAALSAVTFLHWFQAQPYVEIESYTVDLRDAFSWDFLKTVLGFASASLTFVLAILLAYLADFRVRLRALMPGPFIVGALIMGTLIEIPGRLLMGNTVTATGIISSGTETFGGKPAILTPGILWGLKIALFVSGGAAITRLIGKRAHMDRSFRIFLLLYAPSAAAYVLAILYHTLDDNVIFDRYLLEVLPLLAIALLWQYQQTIRATAPIAAWIGVAVLAIYGIATTHDAFAAARARVEAASALIANGIPRTQITAGFAYDGWTELEHSGYINAEDIANPRDAYRSQDNRQYPVSPAYWFREFTPGIEPRYFVVHSRIEGLLNTTFPPVPFVAWIPPFHRQAIIQRAPASSAAR